MSTQAAGNTLIGVVELTGLFGGVQEKEKQRDANADKNKERAQFFSHDWIRFG
jgi:hypothetical protein